MSIDHQQLRCFVEVAASRSINRAAQVLHVSQSALSRRMAALEHAMGAPLFVRSSRGIELTMQGSLLLDRALKLGRELQDLRYSDARKTGADIPVRLKFGVLSGIGTLLFPALLGDLAELSAGDPSVFESSTPVLRDQVRSGVLDLAIVGDSSSDDPLLAFQPLWREQLMLVAPPGCGVQRLLDLPFLLTSEDVQLGSLIHKALRRTRVTPKCCIRVTPTTMARHLIEQGYGYSILHYSAVVADFESARTLIIDPLPGSFLQFGMVRRIDHSFTGATQAFVERMQSRIRQRLSSLPQSLIFALAGTPD